MLRELAASFFVGIIAISAVMVNNQSISFLAGALISGPAALLALALLVRAKK